MQPEDKSLDEIAKTMGHLHAQSFLALESIVFALSKQPSFDAKAFIEALKEEQKTIGAKHEFVHVFLRKLIAYGEKPTE